MFVFLNRRSNHPNHFPKNPRDGWIYLCVIIVNSATTLEAIVDADYSSKVLSNAITEPFNGVKLTRLVIGQEQKNDLADPSFTPEYAFEGRIADLNIWQWSLDEYHVNRWFQGISRDEPPIVAWNTLGDLKKRFGDVHFVSITSAFGRGTFTPCSIRINHGWGGFFLFFWYKSVFGFFGCSTFSITG